MAAEPALTVVKVGGSLYDLPDLGRRLTDWLADIPGPLVVPGGGPTADVVRQWDRCHGLGDRRAHWLALRCLRLNAYFLADLLDAAKAAVVRLPEEAGAVWARGGIAVIDGEAFALADEGRPGCLPHSWDVTSDALAARIALVTGARSLYLLKSVAVPAGMSWEEAGRRGWIDRWLAQSLAQGLPVAVHAVNFREWSTGRPR